MSTASKVTREVFEGYLHCKTKGHLALAGRQGVKTDYEIKGSELMTRQKLGAEANLLAHYQKRTVGKNLVLTTPMMETGPDVILGGKIENELVSLSVDALVKIEPSTKQGKSTYVPVLFHDGEIRAREKALLGLLALIVSELQEMEPTFGFVFHSHGKPKTIRLAPELEIARSVLREVIDLHHGALTPTLVLNNHCQICEFHDQCRAQAVRDDNLSLLQGISEAEIARLNKKGIFTVNQLSYTFKMRRRPKRAKKSSYSHHFPLRALALREKKIFVHGNPVIPIAGTRIYIDIEGTPRGHTYYLIGLITKSRETELHDNYWADTEAGSDQIQIFIRLLDHLSQYPDYCLLHFGSYETVALRRMKVLMPEPYKRQIETALKRSINILSVISSQIYFPTYTNSLKEIGRLLGYQWSDPASSGVQTLVWRACWLSNKDSFVKATLIRYNDEDCVALKGIVEFLEQALTAHPADAFRDRPGTEILSTSALATSKDEQSLFGKTDFVLDDFRTINELSYFDYQRDRAYARTRRVRKKVIVRTKRRLPKPNKIWSCRAAKCPGCHSREIKALSQTLHEVADLRFMRGGIKRWITRYTTWRYRCTRCGNRFVPATFRAHRKLPKYGRGLVSWCIYQLLVGGQNINRIHRSLLELFGLSIPNAAVYKFKRAVAAYFEVGYDNILKDILSGNLINIDETTINLQKEKGYVWVCASSNSVYFFYRNSREGSFLADMLKTFEGVLVSDFYTAYDSLDVAQQRCLIHLMRDMNEDLLKHPFDDELKAIGTGFSATLKAIVETIDKYGLKARHLNKHRRPAEQFCDWVIAGSFYSEAAKNYARRITKYKNYLFAFLLYDGVPWNNNNAEHAIKSFAKFRRFSDGMATEESINDYLTILSICLTCEYRGIEFLKVLLGGVQGDFGFGPKKITPLVMQSTRSRQNLLQRKNTVAAMPGVAPTQMDGASPDDEHGESKIVNLNRLLPRMFGKFRSSFPNFRYRAELAPDLWPAQLDPNDLQSMMAAIIYIFRREVARRIFTICAKNVRFEEPRPAIGLRGRYVAVSIGDGGRVEQLLRPTREDEVPSGFEKNVSLDQVCIFANRMEATANIDTARTASGVVTTTVTAYFSQRFPSRAISAGAVHPRRGIGN